MNREQLISDWIDGTLDEAQKKEAELLIASDPDMAALARDFAALRSWSSEPVALPDMSSDALVRHIARRRNRIRLISSAALALAACTLLFIGGPKAQPEKPAMDELSQAQAAFVSAITRLEHQALPKLDDMPPELAATYRQNLAIIEAAIAQCEDVIEANPLQTETYWALSRAYRAKADLLERVITL